MPKLRALEPLEKFLYFLHFVFLNYSILLPVNQVIIVITTKCSQSFKERDPVA